MSESVFLQNRYLAGFGFCLFLRQNFGSFQQFGKGERQPESEGMRGLCIPGEKVIQRGETETVKHRSYLSMDSKVVQPAFGLSSGPPLLSIIKNGNYLLELL